MSDRVWDMRVVFIERRQRWWWNAWHRPTSTELYWFADTKLDAQTAMHTAMAKAVRPVTAISGYRRSAGAA